MTDEAFDKQININLRGTMLTCQAVIAHMRAAGGGRIVNIASGAAYQALLQQTVYAATKAGVVAMSRVLARELTRDKIVVTVVARAPPARRWERRARLNPVTSNASRARCRGGASSNRRKSLTWWYSRRPIQAIS